MHNHVRTWSALLAIGLMATQFGAIALAPDDTIVRVVMPATIALVPVALWPHRRMLGIPVMFVGLAANLAVVLANGGLMPIERAAVVAAAGEERAASYEAGAWIPGSKDVLVGDGGGRLNALGDAIVIKVGGGFMVASAGDVVIWSGLMLVAAQAAVDWERRRRRAETALEATGNAAAATRTRGGAATSQ